MTVLWGRSNVTSILSDTTTEVVTEAAIVVLTAVIQDLAVVATQVGATLIATEAITMIETANGRGIREVGCCK